ncbi:arginine decarboxylase [Escherichia coli]|uniref:Arginine decarboxylase n=1 Tax=Escherichia coli TaxID=562 RepID=A0A376Y4J5_ECOLX|nr:arginine decarboxylase [Escherichia coli]
MSDDMSMGLPSSAGEHGVLRSMQEVAMSSQEASKMLRTYNIAWWGNNYYDVNELGHISVCPDPDVPEARVDLAQLVKTREAQGQRLPALFCFPQILQHRLRSINAAFKRARESYGYNGDYFLVYPIKVNQHRRVIESLIHSGEPLGLEAGSKAELMAVLAHAGMTRSVIVCNGYKDREYIRLALIGEKMGHKVYLVIEKMSEIAIVLDEAERLNVVPRLGVRARLASQGSGKWQSSGGEKSKFGLAATQVLQLVETLREAGVSTACNCCTSTSVRRWRIFAISPRAFVNPRVSMWNCTSWASIYSASTSAAVWAWTMKAPVRSLTAP